MLRRLYLHGGSAKGGLSDCGGPFSFEADSPAELIQALAAQHDGFDKIMRRGKFHLIAGPLRRPVSVQKAAFHRSCIARTYHLYPAIEGANKGRGKMVLGLTLLGLSFVPSVSAGLGQFGTSLSGSAQFGQSFATIGRQLLSRTGKYLMSQGAVSAISPPHYQAVDEVTPALSPLAQSQAEGITIPLVYGQVRLETPLFIETGLHIDTISL